MNESSDDADLQVLDPDEYGQKRRLKEIYDTREWIREHKTEWQVAVKDPEAPLTQFDAATVYRTALQDYFATIEPLLRVQYPEKGTPIWDEQHFGTIVFQPPTREELEQNWNQKRAESDPHFDWSRDYREFSSFEYRYIEAPEEFGQKPTTRIFEGHSAELDTDYQLTVPVVGISSFFQLPDPMTCEFKVGYRKGSGNHELETRHYTKKKTIGWQICDAAYRAVNRFLAEIGMDIDPENDNLPDDMI